ncbi:hypothetical protein LTR66_005553, partial [Elasticomyces elasticus]
MPPKAKRNQVKRAVTPDPVPDDPAARRAPRDKATTTTAAVGRAKRGVDGSPAMELPPQRVATRTKPARNAKGKGKADAESEQFVNSDIGDKEAQNIPLKSTYNVNEDESSEKAEQDSMEAAAEGPPKKRGRPSKANAQAKAEKTDEENIEVAAKEKVKGPLKKTEKKGKAAASAGIDQSNKKAETESTPKRATRANKDLPEHSPPPPPGRKRGRPPKKVTEEDVVEEIVEEAIEEAQEEVKEAPAKRGRKGKAVAVASSKAVHDKPAEEQAQPPPEKRKPGRPKKNTKKDDLPTPTDPESAPMTNHIGMPRRGRSEIAPLVESTAATPRKRGRPAKAEKTSNDTQKGPAVPKRGKAATKESVAETEDDETEAPAPKRTKRGKVAAKEPAVAVVDDGVQAVAPKPAKRGRPRVTEPGTKSEMPVPKARGRPAKAAPAAVRPSALRRRSSAAVADQLSEELAEAASASETGPAKGKRKAAVVVGGKDKKAKMAQSAADKTEDGPAADVDANATEATTEIADDEPDRQYWLMKAEPESRMEKGRDVKFSIDDLRAKTGPESWDGVRNVVAKNNMVKMRAGDLAFFYHSNCKVPGIAGTMEIVQEATPDLSAFDPNHPYYDPKSTNKEEPKWFNAHVAFRSKFPNLISLKELQSYGKPGGLLESLEVLKQSRLSVSKVTEKEWNFIMSLVEDEDEDNDRQDFASAFEMASAELDGPRPDENLAQESAGLGTAGTLEPAVEESADALPESIVGMVNAGEADAVIASGALPSIESTLLLPDALMPVTHTAGAPHGSLFGAVGLPASTEPSFTAVTTIETTTIIEEVISAAPPALASGPASRLGRASSRAPSTASNGRASRAASRARSKTPALT